MSRKPVFDFKWKDGSHHPAGIEAQVVGRRLESLRKKPDGLTASVVVDDARPVKSPLHPCFEWDDTAAAEEYRKEQARSLIRSVVVVYRDTKEQERTANAFVHVSMNDDPVYTSVAVAMADKDLRQQVLSRALREIETWRNKYKDLKELADIIAAVDEVMAVGAA